MKFIDKDREKHIDLIRAFCSSDEQNGRVLLISGPRGVGKSRLVDEALTPYKESWLSKWGIKACSRPRHKVRRGPRGNKRILLKVNVDAHFPFDSEQSSAASRFKRKANSDNNRNAMLLLRNIIFALTSNIDPRLSWRKHGRTLPKRLGLLDFWLFRPATDMSDSCFWAVVGLCSAIAGISFIGFKPNLVGCAFWSSALTFIIATLAVVILSGLVHILFRFQDWRALSEISHQLYDLAHAQEVEDTDEDLAQKYDAAMHLQHKISFLAWISLLLGILASIYFYCDSPFPNDEELQWFFNWVVKPAPAASGVVAFFGFRFTSNNAQRSHVARYGNKNPAWMVTLLRRYLYIAHRCGIEPVLVFDELDKLEAAFGSNLDAAPPDDEQQLSPRLHAFLGALLRLRDSSGAGFLTILIGGSKLHYNLRRKRQRSLQLEVSMSQTGTLIQQECCVGPISYKAARMYFREKNGGNLDIDYCAYFWLQAHGMGGNYIRLLEQYVSGNNRDINAQQLINAGRLARQLNIVWKLGHCWKVLQFLDGPSDALNHRMSDELWYRCFIRIGMVQYCYALLEGLDAPKSLHYQDAETMLRKKLDGLDFRNAKPKIALVVGSPDLLRLLGQYLIFKRLQAKGMVAVSDSKAGPIRLI